MRDQTSVQRAYGRARRHSRAVSVLKRTLPVAALGIVGGFVAIATLSGSTDVEPVVRSATVTKGEIVMANPRLDGLDRNQRPFALKASAARQETDSPAIVALDRIDAKLPTGDEKFARIDATGGVYDTTNETLVLSDGVAVRDLNGLDMDLEDARLDMGSGTVTTDTPVEVRSRNAAIDAQSMKVLESGKRILFRDRVRMVIHNDKRAEEATQPIGDKSSLLGIQGLSTAPWVHTSKVSIAKFVPAAPLAPASQSVIRISDGSR